MSFDVSLLLFLLSQFSLGFASSTANKHVQVSLTFFTHTDRDFYFSLQSSQMGLPSSQIQSDNNDYDDDRGSCSMLEMEETLPQQMLYSRNVSASQSVRHSTNADHVRDHIADNPVEDIPMFSSDEVIANGNAGNVDDNALESKSPKIFRNNFRFLKRFGSTTPPTESSTVHGCVRNKPENHAFREELESLVYIGVFAIIGTVLRVYMGRFFGSDCSSPTQDFLTPLSSRICVTNSGKTSYPGGAIFTDLPANMLGS